MTSRSNVTAVDSRYCDSSTLGETTEAMNNLQQRPACCRRLFPPSPDAEAEAPGDAENASNRILEEMRQNAMERWNFDFQNEVPLEGRWLWERVEPSPPQQAPEAAEDLQGQQDEGVVNNNQQRPLNGGVH